MSCIHCQSNTNRIEVVIPIHHVQVPVGTLLTVGGDLTAAEGNLQRSSGSYPWTTLQSLGGTMQMLTGGVMVVALGPWLGADPLPMIAGIAFAATVTMGLTLVVAGGQATRKAA